MCKKIKELINSIPKFTTQYGNLYGLTEEFLKEKLYSSEKNKHIIRLARGEGTKKVLRDILDPDLLFDWGVKSNHGKHELVDLRQFLNPYNLDRPLLEQLIETFKIEIQKQKAKYEDVSGELNLEKVKSLLERKNKIDLIILKDFICSVLHTAGSNKDFNKIKPWISTSYGYNRYDTALAFATRGNHKKFVILDYWVPKSEEFEIYFKTYKVIRRLKVLGINWHPDYHKEIMLKYAMFPQYLVGYYYFEKGELKHYHFNHYYIQEWARNEDFKIGQYIHIPQPHVNFSDIGTNNQYKVIYMKAGYHIGIFQEI